MKTEKAWLRWLAERGISERASVTIVDGPTKRKLAERTVRDAEAATIYVLNANLQGRPGA